MKIKILALLLAALVLFSLSACQKGGGNEPSEKEDFENNSGADSSETNEGGGDTAEKEKTYVGVAPNGEGDVHIITSGALVENTHNDSNIRSSSLTNDGKFYTFIRSEKNYDTGKHQDNLYAKTPGADPMLLASGVKDFRINRQNNYAVANTHDGLVYISDLKDPNPVNLGGDYDTYEIFTSNSHRAAAFTDLGDGLFIADFEAKTVTLVSADVGNVVEVVTNDTVYYTKNDVMYRYSKGETSEIGKYLIIDKDVPSVITDSTMTEKKYIVTPAGELVDISNVPGYVDAVSPNGKYITSYTAGNGSALYLYEISDTSAVEKAVQPYEGSVTTRVFDDGSFVMNNAGNSGFGIYTNGVYTVLTSEFVKVSEYANKNYVAYENKTLYYILKDSCKLMKYTVGSDAAEQISENANAGLRLTSDGLYYVTDTDDRGLGGTLWLEGNDAPIIEGNVGYISQYAYTVGAK